MSEEGSALGSRAAREPPAIAQQAGAGQPSAESGRELKWPGGGKEAESREPQGNSVVAGEEEADCVYASVHFALGLIPPS